ncbi:MAG: hypothetical protein U0P45_00395 [Acidimicrobiales bacterium]
MSFHDEAAELADALRTDPSRAPSIKEAALRGRIQARSDVPKGVLLIALGGATVAASVVFHQSYVFMPFALFLTGAALVSRGAKAQRHARVLEAALAQAGLAVGSLPAAAAAAGASSMWAKPILPGVAPSPAARIPAPVRWEAPQGAPAEAPTAPAGPPPNVWSA